ncbi:protein containing Rare lipoprotein A, bacterial domain [Pseudovibrio sp. FO-BEG1]|uniref:Endolytic peptidoglycan transglycosylase RlpA n=1 Tax=Pseudovibrio brasiliensis TaxID=1898042 RepID=A0ABX8AK14_9HYPH|nr:protein containing Rare lipoprotein A, bacterial domain [Pseudovibrio sp. FO-BEG1]QUS54972.1 septal ring lytic transglycosylase RlpA family protein [Pseudovibrio brasiliensis]
MSWNNKGLAHRGSRIYALLLLITAIVIVFVAFILRPHQVEIKTSSQCGEASWYALTSQTASGEMMDPSKLTAAHLTLPMGTRVLVTNLTNGKSLTVRINDRGPYAQNRLIDLSKAAAAELGFIKSGVTQVKISVANEFKQHLKGHKCNNQQYTFNSAANTLTE